MALPVSSRLALLTFCEPPAVAGRVGFTRCQPGGQDKYPFAPRRPVGPTELLGDRPFINLNPKAPERDKVYGHSGVLLRAQLSRGQRRLRGGQLRPGPCFGMASRGRSRSAASHQASRGLPVPEKPRSWPTCLGRQVLWCKRLLKARPQHALVPVSPGCILVPVKRVPGRKSDYLDCQWTQKLHSLGLLTASFRPDAEMRKLRSYLRHRAELLPHRAPHILHMQKALPHMNLQLHHVLSDVTGVTGLKIIRAIVAGERDPLKLAQLRNPACKSSSATIVQALTGTWEAEHLFALRQSLELYDFYTQKVVECDAVIEQHYATLKPPWEGEPPADLPPLKPDSHSKNQPSLCTRAELYRLTGVDVVAVHGISASLAQTILSETGTDVTQWPTEKHFASWLGLAPHNDISGGKELRSRTLPTDNRAGQAFRQAAASVGRSQCAFGAYDRRKNAHPGPMPALVATAHKIARTVYYMLKHRVRRIFKDWLE